MVANIIDPIGFDDAPEVALAKTLPNFPVSFTPLDLAAAIDDLRHEMSWNDFAEYLGYSGRSLYWLWKRAGYTKHNSPRS